MYEIRRERRLGMFMFLFYNWPLRGQEIFTKEQKKDNLVKRNIF